jgi:hypothetical protein
MVGFDTPPGPNDRARLALVPAAPFLRPGETASSMESRISLAVQSQ